jgi:hypothetical protein
MIMRIVLIFAGDIDMSTPQAAVRRSWDRVCSDVLTVGTLRGSTGRRTDAAWAPSKLPSTPKFRNAKGYPVKPEMSGGSLPL